jgi:uncharacterized repeat protein (TIGR03803 family)
MDSLTSLPNHELKLAMKRLVLSSLLISSLPITGCAHAVGPQMVPAGVASDAFPVGKAAARYHVVYSFGSSAHDGAFPYASLIDVNGIFYGTTEYGGRDKCQIKYVVVGCGTVFGVSSTGSETVLHRFANDNDGAWPDAGLIEVNNTLYGTTANGGAYGNGSVFSVSLTGTEHVLHSFGGTNDGVGPDASLIDVKGSLDGTTSDGGAYGWGDVFSLNRTTDAERVLYNFKGGRKSGTPSASLIDVNGTLYGTTYGSGASACASGKCGAVFSMSTTGAAERVLYRFKGGKDGAVPYASLIDVKGTLYGTTEAGGGSSACNGGCGTVFSMSTTGAERVIYSFTGAPDGAFPLASLIDVKHRLYGTTSNGGSSSACRGGCGTVFSLSTTGTERVLHSFGGNDDGVEPSANLIDVNGILYGTTISGGARNKGTVFALRL